MKKEVFIAIFIGFVIGLLITFGIYTAQRSLQNSPQSLSDSAATPTPFTTPVKTANISVSYPENGELVSEATLTLTGATVPDSLVAILSGKDSTTVPADEQGNFSGLVTLSEGANQIVIKAFGVSGEESRVDLTVVYIPKTNATESTPSPTLKIKPTSNL